MHEFLKGLGQNFTKGSEKRGKLDELFERLKTKQSLPFVFPAFSAAEINNIDSYTQAGKGQFSHNIMYFLFENISFDPSARVFVEPPNFAHSGKDWWTIQGGLSEIIHSMSQLIPPEQICMNSKITTIEFIDAAKRAKNGHKLRVTSFSNQVLISVTETFDKLLVTIPAPPCNLITWSGFGS